MGSKKQYWLVKSEPGEYAWNDLVEAGDDYWDGVRNYQARNNLQSMRRGDRCLFYHSVKAKQVIGVAEITREHYPDPTTDDERWVVVNMKPVLRLQDPVSLTQIKADPELNGISLVKQSRLSVMPVEQAHYERILDMGGGTTRSLWSDTPAPAAPPKKKKKKKVGKKKATKKKATKKKA